MDGWIKLSKKLLSWEWFDKSEMVHLFIYCLLNANFEPKKWHGITVERGSFLTSLTTINRQTGISQRTLRTCLDRLKSTNELTIKTTNRYTLITICKYDSYQVDTLESDKQNDMQNDNQLTNKGHANDKQPTTTKEYKEYKKNNKEIIPKGIKEKRKVFQKPTVEEIQSYIHENGYSVDAERFFNFYESKGWMVGKNHMKDWKAAVRTWQKGSNKNYNENNRTDNKTERQKEFKNYIYNKLGNSD